MRLVVMNLCYFELMCVDGTCKTGRSVQFYRVISPAMLVFIFSMMVSRS